MAAANIDSCYVCLVALDNNGVFRPSCGHGIHVQCFRESISMSGEEMLCLQRCGVCRNPYSDEDMVALASLPPCIPDVVAYCYCRDSPSKMVGCANTHFRCLRCGLQISADNRSLVPPAPPIPCERHGRDKTFGVVFYDTSSRSHLPPDLVWLCIDEQS